MRRSPIHEAAAARGACFIHHHDRELAGGFGDPRREHAAVRRSAGLLDLSYLGKLRISGGDCVRYLHNMLSNDIKRMAPGTGCHAAVLSRQGHVEADVHVYRRTDDFLMECMPACASRLAETLAKYIVADDVTLEDVVDHIGILSLQGPEARRILEDTVGEKLAIADPLTFQSFGRPGGAWIAAARDRTGSGGFDLWLPAAEIEAVWRALADGKGIQPVGFEALDILRAEAGIPWYGMDLDEKTLPMEAGLEDVISLVKGCYRGQEIMARIMHRGRLDRGFGGLAIDAPDLPPAGAPLFAGEDRVGRVTSAVISPTLDCPLALGIIEKEFLTPGTRVEVQFGAGRFPARVVKLPLGNRCRTAISPIS